MRLRRPVGFKPLAIRILDPHMTQRPEVVRMFLDEQRAAAVLQHPRVANVHEVGAMPDGSYFVAGEYVHGIPLREVMRSPQAQLRRRTRCTSRCSCATPCTTPTSATT